MVCSKIQLPIFNGLICNVTSPGGFSDVLFHRRKKRRRWLSENWKLEVPGELQTPAELVEFRQALRQSSCSSVDVLGFDSIEFADVEEHIHEVDDAIVDGTVDLEALFQHQLKRTV